MQHKVRHRHVVCWSIVSFALSILLHLGPMGYFFLAPLYGLPDVLELDLKSINFYRDRVFRNLQTRQQAPEFIPPALQVSVTLPGQVSLGERISKPRKEDDLMRARAVQQAIRALCEKVPAKHTGYALVSLNIQDDGSIGEYAIRRLSGGEEFQEFLFDFLFSLKAFYSNEAGPGESMWIECEFVVKPLARRKAS